MAVTKPRLTEEEFLRLPDDGYKYELVEGEARMTPVYFEHDAVGANIVAMLMPHTRGRGALSNGQAGFRMKNGNVRCPDVSFTRKERLPGGRVPRSFGDAAPDLCIEIISASEDPVETARKVREYFEAGAEQVWHLFPETTRLVLFHSPDRSIEYGPEEELEGGNLLPGFLCKVAELFEIGLE
jgi:Uma2 family endonuclease